jgi:hypothetical protein
MISLSLKAFLIIAVVVYDEFQKPYRLAAGLYGLIAWNSYMLPRSLSDMSNLESFSILETEAQSLSFAAQDHNRARDIGAVLVYD